MIIHYIKVPSYTICGTLWVLINYERDDNLSGELDIRIVQFTGMMIVTELRKNTSPYFRSWRFKFKFIERSIAPDQH